MSVSYPLTATARSDAAVSSVEIPQLRIRAIFAVWAAAALPMAVLAWLVAPVLADRFAGDGHVPMAKALIVSPHDRPGLAVRPRRDPRRPRAGDAPLVDGPRGALAPLPAEPAQRPRRRSGLAGPDPADRRLHRGAGAGRDRARRPRPGLRHAPRVGRRQGVPGRGLGLVRPHPRALPLQHRARRGAPVPRVPPSAHERRLRTRRLGRERPPLRRLPPARAVGDPGDAARHVHSSPTRRSATGAPGSGSRCTAPRACSSGSSSSRSSSEAPH